MVDMNTEVSSIITLVDSTQHLEYVCKINKVMNCYYIRMQFITIAIHTYAKAFGLLFYCVFLFEELLNA